MDVQMLIILQPKIIIKKADYTLAKKKLIIHRQ